MMKLAIITSHPIQYNAPLFKLLTQRGNVSIKVFYTWGKKSIEPKFDPGFGKTIKWDIPLLDGYDYEFLENTSTKPGSSHFKGIINPDIIKKINEFQPTALLVYGWAFKSHLKVLRHFSNKTPILFRGDSTLLNDKTGFKQSFRKLFLSWVYKKIDYALYVGTNNKNYYKAFGLKEKQLVFAPHCVDSSRFSLNNDNTIALTNQLKQEVGLTVQDFVFLYAGKLEPVKNVGLLLDAFVKAQFDNNVKLVVVGNGPLENDIKNQFGNSSNICFLPFQNQKAMPTVYKMAHYYILPSKSETWGLAINEAMACGKPAIASDKCGCAIDLVEDGKTGFIFQSEDEESLMSALKKAYNEKENYLTFSNNSSKRVSNFSLENVAIAIERAMLEVKKLS
jgi:glycosyltransferase involved in cell wall biosynthesis